MKLLLTTIKSDNKRTDLELKYLFSVVTDSPVDVQLRTYERTDLYADIFEDIATGQYNMVYFHANDENEAKLRHVAEMVKKAVPSIAVLFGGMQVSFETRSFMKEFPFVDYVIRGEGESVMFNFLKSILDYEFDFENIAGLAYRENDEIIVNPYDAPVDVESLPFPYEKFEAGKGTVYYETIRGTSDRTVYSQHLPDARVRALSLGRVCTELRYFLAKEVSRVVFLDRFFNFNSERAYRIFEFIINNDNGVTSFEFNVNGDELDEETIRLLSEARSGQIIFNIDIASTNAEVLAAIGRGENIYRLMYNTTKLLQAGNIVTEIHVKAGLPLETEAMFARSFNKAFGMAEGMPVHIDGLYISKGTDLRADSNAYGYVFAYDSPYEVIATSHMTAEEMLRIRGIARTVESYVGDGGFKKSIPRVLNDTGIKPYDLFSRLSSFITKKGLGSKTRKKEHLARILFAFAGGLYDDLADPVKLDILKDVIYADLETMISEDALKKFDKKGWDID
ncbi:MAG: DUF4080 domain-containing protein [Mogibacterium sp.]|nr:DUF4080 domain-containing protein [Mogibacterium sp.]